MAKSSHSTKVFLTHCYLNVVSEFKKLYSLSSQENLQTLGAEIERLIKQQREPEDRARRK